MYMVLHSVYPLHSQDLQIETHNNHQNSRGSEAFSQISTQQHIYLDINFMKFKLHILFLKNIYGYSSLGDVLDKPLIEISMTK